MQAFAALADPTRRDVLIVLADGERTAGDVAARFSLTRQAVSHHLQVLRDAGLAVERRDGRRRWYRARPEGLVDVAEYVDRFWAVRLVRLQAAVEAESRT